jgi:cephalosporin-C deacetylase-like acetyl esterase
LHQTVDQGKQEPIGLKGDPGMAYGLEMVLRGYVVLAPDTITAGERVLTGEIFFDTTAFDSANPNWSAMGKMLWDHQRGIDLLQTIKEVHSDRIGVIGHSLGGYNALFLAAFDERIKAVAVSCPYTRIQTDPGKERWSRSTGFIHFPKLRPYVAPDSSMTVPWDFHNVLSLIVPRPLFQSIALNDTIFPNSTTVAQIHMFVWPMYNAMNSAQNLITIFNQGEHGFPNEAREMAYEFLDNIL